MRISDWSSDVCSSDLRIKKRIVGETEAGFPIDNKPTGDTFPVLNNVGRFWISDIDQPRANIADSEQQLRWHRGRDLLNVNRKSGVEGKVGAVRVDLVGRRCIKQKTLCLSSIKMVS